MPKKKIEVYNKDELIYPFIESDHVSFSNGMKVGEMLNQSISMPTVAHEDLSFKVGVGDQDVSSAIVDSSVSKMTIKGKTYQNILPEPSTHVLTNNKEMFKVNEGLDPNVEIVDGVSKSAILSGQTLVNVLAYIKVGGNVPLVKNGNVIEVESTTENTWRSVDIDFTYLKPNTKYIVTWDSIAFSNPNFVPTSSLISVRLKTDNTQIAGWNSSQNYIIATTPSDASDVKLRVHASQGTAVINKTTVKGLKVVEYVEGMENWDVPYFEGMSSCKMPVLQTVGKNLFDGILKQGYIGDASGEANTSKAGVHSPNYMKVKPNTTYIRTITGSYPSGVSTRVYFYDMNKTYLGIYKDGTTFTTPENAQYMRFRYYVVSGEITPNDFSESNIQMEEGSTATSYEPHKSNILSTQINLTSDMFEQGGITTTKFGVSYSAVKTSRTDRIRVKELIPVKPSTSYYLKLPTEINGWCNMYDKNGLLLNTGSINANTMGTTSDETYYVGVVLNKKDSSLDITPSEIGGKTMFLSQEVVLRSLPNGVKDTLNLMTGEYVQRIGEITVCPTSVSQIEILSQNYTNTIMARIKSIPSIVIKSKMDEKQHLCDKYPYEFINDDYEHVYFNVESNPTFAIFLKRSKLSSQDANGVFQYLSNNPIVIQSELATPVVKIVDLSSSGNWEKIVLNGSETGWSNSYSEWANKVFCLNNRYLPNVIKPTSIYGTYVMCDKLRGYTIQWLCAELGRTGVALYSWGSGYLQIAINGVNTVDELKQYLSQNPVTVWYQTATHQDSTQVKQPIFFKDGHIIQSSGVDNSLIPTLDYQAKTSNSYVMDLMKTNTKCTMKAKSASGTFTIDGTSYGAGTNGTFTTPSSMTNKFLVMSNKTNEEVMILEGDVVSKTIPYFKGIKSVFEDESKIEVLSTGKNLFDGELELGIFTLPANSTKPEKVNNENYIRSTNAVSVLPNKKYILSSSVASEWFVGFLGGQGKYVSKSHVSSLKNTVTFTTPNDCNYICFYKKSTDVKLKIQLEESSTATQYEPYKTNNTKIPLLSPLRSLPNGVCDEIVLDRENNKAKIIQRVGKAMVLETPVITEVDLEGFPYIYKDGHIFLNSEIAPTTEITYSINQCQQISASNEDIIRHEKELTYLQKLIAQYVQVDYESVLLSLKV